MLQPKRTKFRKTQKGRNRGLAERGSKVSFGEYATSSGAARFGFVFSLTSRLPVSRWKSAREKVRATLSIGWRRFSRVVCCMRSREYRSS